MTDGAEKPEPQRTFAIGDVHGCATALQTLLDGLHIEPTDRIVFLGDLVDRGPDSARVLEQVLQLRNVCKVIGILGNHEEMMLHAIEGEMLPAPWLHCGGDTTVESYGSIDEIPDSHVQFIRSMRDIWETDRDILVHANLDLNRPLSEQFAPELRWLHLHGIEQSHPSGKRIICGHTRIPTGRPVVFPGWVCIDTWACGGKYLTGLELETNLVWQANEDGDSVSAIPLEEIAGDPDDWRIRY